MQNAEAVAARESKSRMQVIYDCLEKPCAIGCGNVDWLQYAEKILVNNWVNLYVYVGAIQDALEKGRCKASK